MGAQPDLDWDCTHFTRAGRQVYAIVDVVSRYWIGWLSSSEQTTTQVQLLFTYALADQGLLGPDGRPIRQAHARRQRWLPGRTTTPR